MQPIQPFPIGLVAVGVVVLLAVSFLGIAALGVGAATSQRNKTLSRASLVLGLGMLLLVCCVGLFLLILFLQQGGMLGLGGTATQAQPQMKVGEIIAAGPVEVFIPPESQGKQPPISVKPVSQPLPPPPKDSNAVGEAYEISAPGKLAGDVLITLQYDPAGLPAGIDADNLYLATLVGDEWQVVPDGLVDTENHTVSANVSHLSFFEVLGKVGDAIYSKMVSRTGDAFAAEDFDALPAEIRQDVYADGILRQEVKAAVKVKLSRFTKAATKVIPAANAVSTMSGLVIAKLKGGREVVERAIAEMVLSEVGGRAGSLGVMLYDAYGLGQDIKKLRIDPTQADPYLIAADAAALLLAAEMDYINSHIDKALVDLYQFNPESDAPLQITMIYVEGKKTGYKYYYYDEKQGRWLHYYDNLVSGGIKFEPDQPVAQATATKAGILDDVRSWFSAPSATPVPSATSIARAMATATARPAATGTLRATSTLAPRATATPIPKPTATGTLAPKPTATPTRPMPTLPPTAVVPTRAPNSPTPPGGGGKIAFVAVPHNKYAIYVMNLDGSGLQPLTEEDESRSPAWSPDGKRIAFNRDLDIYIMNADGSNKTRVTRSFPEPCGPAEYPAWSPDGQRIAFESSSSICVINADGTGEVVALARTREERNSHDSHPSWSPDGGKIVYYGWYDDDIEISVMNSDGSGRTRLTYSQGHDWEPVWSPDGRKITFGSDRDREFAVYTMNADGSNQTRLIDGASPSWSPDSRRLVFERFGSIWVINADGSNAIRVNKSDEDVDYREPAWSPR